jgi:hypothetical protein
MRRPANEQSLGTWADGTGFVLRRAALVETLAELVHFSIRERYQRSAVRGDVPNHEVGDVGRGIRALQILILVESQGAQDGGQFTAVDTEE